MEAVGSGLGMIDLMNYGSPTFIRHHQNGYLIPIDFEQASTDDITTQIAHMIIRYFEDGPIRAHEVSYDIAESFKHRILLIYGDNSLKRCYMINLFENYNQETQELHQSLKRAGYNHFNDCN